MNRRDFVSQLTLAAAASAALPGVALAAAHPLLDRNGKKIPLGMDNFAVRAFNWKGRELVDYAASLQLDTLFITDLPALGTQDPMALHDLSRYAADKGLKIELGTWSICPTSVRFKKDWGTAEQHLGLGLRLAKDVGSPVLRVVLGAREDRKTPGGIQARIEDTVRVCHSQKGLAADYGVKIAIENHAGDMTAHELVGLVEAAGKDYVGVNLDSGNAAWTLEDPMASLEILGPYTLTSSLRDSAICQTEKGCKVQWTAMGRGGCVDLKRYFERFSQLCPGVSVNIETIGGFAIEFPYFESSFWEAFPEMRASDFAKFVDLARKGKPVAQFDGNSKEKQREELEASILYCKDVIGLGQKD